MVIHLPNLCHRAHVNSVIEHMLIVSWAFGQPRVLFTMACLFQNEVVAIIIIIVFGSPFYDSVSWSDFLEPKQIQTSGIGREGPVIMSPCQDLFGNGNFYSTLHFHRMYNSLTYKQDLDNIGLYVYFFYLSTWPCYSLDLLSLQLVEMVWNNVRSSF